MPQDRQRWRGIRSREGFRYDRFPCLHNIQSCQQISNSLYSVNLVKPAHNMRRWTAEDRLSREEQNPCFGSSWPGQGGPLWHAEQHGEEEPAQYLPVQLEQGAKELDLHCYGYSKNCEKNVIQCCGAGPILSESGHSQSQYWKFESESYLVSLDV